MNSAGERLAARLDSLGETASATIDVNLQRWVAGGRGAATLAITPGRLWWSTSSRPMVASFAIAEVSEVQCSGGRSFLRSRGAAGVRIRVGRGWLRFTADDGTAASNFVSELRHHTGL